MTIDNFEPLLEHIATRIGLRARPSDRAEWGRAIKSRMSIHRIARTQEYLQLLKSETSDTGGEWRWLLPLLTNGESYFLRDEGQFSLLRNRILPELIEKRKNQKSLRIWSAGCSTGEEPYSLAILIQDIVPPNWNVSIIGTDVNEEALQKARRGIYSLWSFRALSAELRERCFHRVTDGFELDETLRKMVRFERDNLSDNTQGAHAYTQDMDLILCRNVLIYFQHEAVTRAIARFASSLREGGYLLTGHAELHHHNVAPLKSRSFPESVAYQRSDALQTPEPIVTGRQITTSLSFSKPSSKSIPIPTLKPSPKTTVPVVKVPTRPQLNTEQVKTEKRAESVALKVEALCQAARVHANAGRHEEAVACCKEAIGLDPVATDAYFVWGQVSHEQGNFTEAKELFKKVVYLSLSHVEAYIELASMYDLENDAERAHRMRLAALSALRNASADKTFASGISAQELKKELERLVNQRNDRSRG